MQNTAYEMRISDWSSDVCSSDLLPPRRPEWMFRSAGFRVLYETEWDFGDGVKCPAVIVDGRNVTVNEIAAVYDILRHNTAISNHFNDHRRPNDPPPRPQVVEEADDRCPW